MNPDRDQWAAAGGNLQQLDIYASIGKVCPLSDGSGRVLASIHPDRPTVGAIGDWHGGEALLRRAEDWLRAQGCTAARGPMELCRWFNYRANLGPFSAGPLSFEPTQPAGPWLDAGYEIIARYVSVLTDHQGPISAGMDRAAGLSSRGWTLRPLPTGPDGALQAAGWVEVTDMIHRVATDAFADLEGYVPIPFQAVLRFFAPHKDHVDPRLTLLAFTPKQELAGFLLAIPDHVQPDRRWFQLMTLAVLPEHRHAGVGVWLLAAAHQAARRAGYEKGVHCMVRVREGSDFSSWTRGKVLRRYVLLERAL